MEIVLDDILEAMVYEIARDIEKDEKNDVDFQARFALNPTE